MKKMFDVFIFVSGAVVGAGGSWYFLKRIYEDITAKEISKFKDEYHGSKKTPDETSTDDSLEELNTSIENQGSLLAPKPDLAKYVKKVADEGYVDYSATPAKKKSKQSIYIIAPDKFGEDDEYGMVTLSYYSDGVVTGDNEEPINNVESIIGDALDHFGEYEDDAVYIRNDDRHCDYEILKEYRSYSETVKNRPPNNDVDEED